MVFCFGNDPAAMIVICIDPIVLEKKRKIGLKRGKHGLKYLILEEEIEEHAEFIKNYVRKSLVLWQGGGFRSWIFADFRKISGKMCRKSETAASVRKTFSETE